MSLLDSQFGLDLASIDEIILNGARASFLPADRKAALVSAFQSELDLLKGQG